MKNFVIAGNYQQYTDFVRKQVSLTTASYKPTDFVCVTGPESLRGYSNPHGWFVGTWRQRPDIKDIMESIVTQYSDQHIPDFIIKTWNELKFKLPV